MDFKEEYKNAAEELTPTRAQIDRMKANVIREIRSPRRNKLMSRIVYVGGTVAACAVITVTAVVLFPQLKSKDSLTNPHQQEIDLTASMSSSAAADEPENKDLEYITDSKTPEYTLLDEVIAENAAEDIMETPAEDSPPDMDISSITGGGAPVAPIAPAEKNEETAVTTVNSPSAPTAVEDETTEWEVNEEDENNFHDGEIIGTITEEEPEEAYEETASEPAEVEDALEEPQFGMGADKVYDETGEIEEPTFYTTEEVAEESEEEAEFEEPEESLPEPIISNKLLFMKNDRSQIYLSYKQENNSLSRYFNRTESPVNIASVYRTVVFTDITTGTDFEIEFLSEDESRLYLWSLDRTEFIGEYILG